MDTLVVKVDGATPKSGDLQGAMINQYMGVAPSTFQVVYPFWGVKQCKSHLWFLFWFLTAIFTYEWLRFMVHVGKYASAMDLLGC